MIKNKKMSKAMVYLKLYDLHIIDSHKREYYDMYGNQLYTSGKLMYYVWYDAKNKVTKKIRYNESSTARVYAVHRKKRVKWKKYFPEIFNWR